MLENPGRHNFLGLALVTYFCQLGPVSQRLHRDSRSTNCGLRAQASKSVEDNHRIFSFNSWFCFSSSSFMYPKLIGCSHEVSGDICSIYNALQTSCFTVLLSGSPCMQQMSNSIKNVLHFILGWRKCCYYSVWLYPRHTLHGTQWELGVSDFAVLTVEHRGKSPVILILVPRALPACHSSTPFPVSQSKETVKECLGLREEGAHGYVWVWWAETDKPTKTMNSQ